MLKLLDSFGDEIEVKQWRFPCGEVGVSIHPDARATIEDGDIKILLQWDGNDDLFALAQLVDIVRHAHPTRIILGIPYFPYSRQDRRVNPGEAHALKIAGAFINSLKVDLVVSFDPHSSVMEAVIDNFYSVSQAECAGGLPEHDFLIAPDTGAEKKVYTHNQVVEGLAQVITATKRRDATGRIIRSECEYAYRVFDKKVCVVDDICDGGATFIELGNILKANEPRELNLYVTHGFFTKGLDDLKKIYDNIYVKNLPNKAFADQIKEI